MNRPGQDSGIAGGAPPDKNSASGEGRGRLQKILSAHGAASRREAERMILDGRVSVNGKPATLGQSADPSLDTIAIDGKPLTASDKRIYIMLNKPRGFVTTVRDERGRKTVMSLVAGAGARVYPVGRLDMDSEGLLLMTNDGRFANRVAHPSYSSSKTYTVCVRGDAAGAVEALSAPIEIDARVVKADSVSLEERTPEGGALRVTIHEGRNRQIRKMCELCGLEVLSLKRVSVGALGLGRLKPGQWRYLTEEEVSFFG